MVSSGFGQWTMDWNDGKNGMLLDGGWSIVLCCRKKISGESV